MNNKPWTDEEKIILREMAQAGKNKWDIARVLKSRTSDAIANKATSLCISLSGGLPEINMDEYKRIMEGVD